MSAHLPGDTVSKCLTCGHPTTHHDAGECWTNDNGTESVDATCGCGWLKPDRCDPNSNTHTTPHKGCILR